MPPEGYDCSRLEALTAQYRVEFRDRLIRIIAAAGIRKIEQYLQEVAR